MITTVKEMNAVRSDMIITVKKMNAMRPDMITMVKEMKGIQYVMIAGNFVRSLRGMNWSYSIATRNRKQEQH
jgi:hypothetical protein